MFADLFFNQILSDLCLESSQYAGSRHGIKQAAGVHTLNPATSDAEQQQHYTDNLLHNIKKDVDSGMVFNLIDMLAGEGSSSDEKTKIKRQLINFVGIPGANYLNSYSRQLNGEYKIPKFRLPDVLEHLDYELKSLKRKKDSKYRTKINFGEKIYNILYPLYSEYYDTSLSFHENSVRSFKKKKIERTYSDGNGGTIKRLTNVPAIIGGESEVDRQQGGHVHITRSPSELKRKNEMRLRKVGDKTGKIFTFDRRYNPDEQGRNTPHTPEKPIISPQAEPAKKKPAKKKAKKKVAPPAKKKATPPAKKKATPPAKKKATPPAKKKTIKGESLFFKEIPF
jgi:hypothetical protein